MRERLSRAIQQPFYLWLLGIYPIIYLYSVNFGLVIDHEVFTSLAGMLAATTLVFFLTNAVIRDKHRTAFILGIASICFSFSGHIYTLVFMPKSLFIWTLIVSIAAVFIMVGIYRKGSRKFLARITATINLISLAILISPSTTIIAGHAYMSSFDPTVLGNGSSISTQQESPKVKDSASRPDIYYIIPDSYPSDAWLKEAMDYDNSAFTQALRDRGFLVAEHAQSNYGATLTSLASTLNMRYYDNNPSQLSDLDFLRLSVAESEVAQKLQQLGYTYIHLLSGLMIPSSIADINHDYAPAGVIEINVDQSDYSAAILYHAQAGIRRLLDRGSLYKQSFTSLYLDTTLLRIVKSQLDKLLHADKYTPFHVYAAERFLTTLNDVSSFSSMPEATFAIVHLLKPHFPVVFNADGDIIPSIEMPSPQEYFDELQYVNSKFLEMIDRIIENSENQPVIMFQADHGSTFGYPNTAVKRYIHFDTYAAYLLPDEFSLDIPQPYTLINSFPLILNEVFDLDLGLRDDHLMELLRRYKAPFIQAEVTDEFLNK